jgi:DNA ligase-1
MRYLLYFLISFSFSSFAAEKPNIQLATIYHQDIDISDYFVSEKLDGIRGYWDGEQLISRQGNLFHPPKWFVKNFPNVPLDGELWIARQSFEKVSSIVRDKKGDPQRWKQVSFMIFDLPQSDKPFSERLLALQKLIDLSDSPYLKLIPQHKVKNNDALQSLLDETVSKGGEGLMLHKESALYQAKRSKDLLKLKKYEDEEALVVSYIAGKGRNEGRLGALVVKNEDGIVFKIGSGFSDSERDNPPKIGDVITYKFIGKTKNKVPRFASYLRIRRDY